MHVLGLDIGGANLKAADNNGKAASRPFALWREPRRLSGELASLLKRWSDNRSPRTTHHALPRIAVTMTAELCDCFASKAEGIDFILRAVEEAAAGTEILVWQTGGEFVPPAVARDIPALVAAANWHALATFCGRLVPRAEALLIDIGSTTTDIIPLQNGQPVPRGMTDRERLATGELVYTGIRRTPLCALCHHVVLDGVPHAIAAEVFATTGDVYLLLGDLPEDPLDCHSADGRPATREAAQARLARMLCADVSEFGESQWQSLAEQFADAQQQQIATSIARVWEQCSEESPYIVAAGSGEFLVGRMASAQEALKSCQISYLSQTLSPALTESACAFAVAKLAAEWC